MYGAGDVWGGAIRRDMTEMIYETRTSASRQTENPGRKFFFADEQEVEDLVNIPASMGSELHMQGYEGLLTMEVLGELDSYRRDDSELDKKILELLRPTQSEEDLRWYVE